MTPRWLTEAADDVTYPANYGAGPATLFFDLETTPMLGWTWGTYKQNVIRTAKPRYVLSFAYRWEGEGETTRFVAGWQDPKWRPDHPWTKPKRTVDRYTMARLWHLLDRADTVIGHNGDKFDVRRSNARFIVLGVTPPSPYRTVDTLKEYRRYADFASNRLGDLGAELGVGGKVGHAGFDTWLGAMGGSVEHQEMMEAYNVGDVDLLVDVYDKILPWVGTPGKAFSGSNHGLWSDGRPVCPTCGGQVHARGTYRSKTRVYKRWQCQECGGWSRSRLSERDYDGSPQLV